MAITIYIHAVTHGIIPVKGDATVLKSALQKTRQGFFGKIASILGNNEINEETWEDLESLLIQSDVGLNTSLKIVHTLRKRVEKEGLLSKEILQSVLKEELIALLPDTPAHSLNTPRLLSVLLIVGVNGAGKTTTIAKLARQFKQEGRDVLLAAADTFRAAAVDQLKQWGEKLDVPVIAGQPGGDPGAVVYDAIRAARARSKDLLIVDTAGRLHTKYNLMEELKKISLVLEKNVHQAPHEVWLILDGTTGQNALSQARHFKDSVNVTGVIVTKLDSSARGGMIFALQQEMQLPVRFLGVGEKSVDLLPFNKHDFVTALIDQE